MEEKVPFGCFKLRGQNVSSSHHDKDILLKGERSFKRLSRRLDSGSWPLICYSRCLVYMYVCVFVAPGVNSSTHVSCPTNLHYDITPKITQPAMKNFQFYLFRGVLNTSVAVPWSSFLSPPSSVQPRLPFEDKLFPSQPSVSLFSHFLSFCTEVFWWFLRPVFKSRRARNIPSKTPSLGDRVSTDGREGEFTEAQHKKFPMCVCFLTNSVLQSRPEGCSDVQFQGGERKPLPPRWGCHGCVRSDLSEEEDEASGRKGQFKVDSGAIWKWHSGERRDSVWSAQWPRGLWPPTVGPCEGHRCAEP